MKILFFILSCFTALTTFSQDSCVVKIFPNDCRNCYIGISGIKSGGDDVKKTIVFPKLPQAEINAYLKNVLNITDISKYTVIVSDSVYKSLDKNLTSEVFVYRDNKIYDHILLKKFHGIKVPDTFSIAIPDSIPVTNEATIINHNDYFFITDPKFGNCIFINKLGFHEITVLSARDFTTKAIFDVVTGDTVCYQMFSKYRKPLKSANMDKIQFSPSYGKDVMASFISIPNIVEKNKNVGLTYKYGIIVFKNPNEYGFLRIDDETLPNNYVLYPGFFVEYGGSYYIQVVSKNENNNDQYLLAEFKRVNNALVFSRFARYKLPYEYLPAGKYSHLRKVFIPSPPYAFLQYSRSYYDMKHDTVRQLPLDSVKLQFDFPGHNLNLLKFSYHYKITDACVVKDTVQVLIEKSGKYSIAYINSIDNKLIKEVKIKNPVKSLKIGMYFFSGDRLFYLTKDNQIVVEKILPE